MFYQKTLFMLAGPKGSGKTHIGTLVNQHTDVVPVIDRVYHLRESAEAIRYFAREFATRKVVFTVDQEQAPVRSQFKERS